MTGALLLAIAVQASPAALIPAFFTGDSIHEICSRPNAGQCSMYVAGVLDGIFFSQAEAGAALRCRSAINNREAAELVIRYLEENPGMRGRAAAVAVSAAVAEALDCAGGPQATGAAG